MILARKLLDQVIVPAGTLGPNQSYARVSDAADQWEVKGGSEDKYVTPSTNNKTLDSNAKMEKFEEHDSCRYRYGYFCHERCILRADTYSTSAFKIVGKVSVNLSKRNAMKAKGITDKQEAKEKQLAQAPGEVYAAISMAIARNARVMYTMWKTRY